MKALPLPGRAEFLGLDYDLIDTPGVVSAVLNKAAGAEFVYLVTPNVDHVVRLHQAKETPEGTAMWQAYAGAWLTTCDSRILALLARLSGIELPVAAGSDVTADLLSDQRLEGMRIAVAGGDASQIDWLRQNLPHTQWLHYLPPMGVRRDKAAQLAIAEFVEQAAPQITLFAIGAPQSELVAHIISQRGKAKGVGLCIGASIEFLTGAKRRAPQWMQDMRLEWAFRLASEPRRLWRRYLIEGPQIFVLWRRWQRARQS